MTDRDLGELIGTMRAMGERMGHLERTAQDGFRTLEARMDKRDLVMETRLTALEHAKVKVVGIMAAVGVLYTLALILLSKYPLWAR